MRQVWIIGTGGPEKLQLREAPDPVPQAGEVRARVAASGITFADILVRLGLYPGALSSVTSTRVTVDAVGADVDAAWTGNCRSRKDSNMRIAS